MSLHRVVTITEQNKITNNNTHLKFSQTTENPKGSKVQLFISRSAPDRRGTAADTEDATEDATVIDCRL